MNHKFPRTIVPLLLVAILLPIILPTPTTTTPPPTSPTRSGSNTETPVGTAIIITAAIAGGLVYLRSKSRETFTKLATLTLALTQQFILITAPIALALSMWMGWIGVWDCASNSCTISRGWAQPMFLYLIAYSVAGMITATMIDRKINQPLANR